MQNFSCDFGGGCICQMSVTDNAPPKGKSHIVEIQWTTRPRMETLRHYINWMNSVNQDLATTWGKKLMHCYQLERNWGRFEIWVYEPGGNPKLVEAK